MGEGEDDAGLKLVVVLSKPSVQIPVLGLGLLGQESPRWPEHLDVAQTMGTAWRGHIKEKQEPTLKGPTRQIWYNLSIKKILRKTDYNTTELKSVFINTVILKKFFKGRRRGRSSKQVSH